MKKIHRFNKVVLGSLAVAALMGVTSCDPLGIEPTTKVDVNNFWLSPQLSRSYVNNFYFWGETASGQTFQSEQWSDNCQGNSEKDWNTYYQGNFTNRSYDSESGSTVFSAPWGESYKRIRTVNIAIEKLSGSTVLTEDLKSQLLGESYFFRAYTYFDMLKYWGAVPYVDKILSLNDETYLPREKREVVFDNILKDLQTSLGFFTTFGKKGDLGMVNADVVNAYISRVALYAANAAEASTKGLFASNDPKGLFTFTKSASEYYKIAENAGKQVLGKYSLETEYEHLFTSSDAHKSKETIWPVMFRQANREGFNPTGINGPDGKLYGGTTDASYDWDFRSGLFPTQDLVDCYLQKDEVDGKWKNWWKTSQAIALKIKVVDGEITGEGADYRKIYQNRDKRFYATVTYDGSYMGAEKEMNQIQTWIDNSDPITPENPQSNTLKYSALHTGYKGSATMRVVPDGRGSAQTITGYYSRKYSQFNSYNDNGTLKRDQRTTCYFNIRYAEVLLNLAEANYKLGGGDAEGYVNQIRERAGLDKFNAAEAQHNLWEEIKLQRRLEFAFECPGFRYFDLLRWSEAEGKQVIPELNKPSRGIHIFRKGIESEKVGENGYPVEAGGEGYFTPFFTTASMNYAPYQRKFDNSRYYFMPFSTTTLSSYTTLVQNPGWENFKYNN